MILESLVKYYEALVERGQLLKPGWSRVDVSYALDIDEQGNLKRVISLKTQDGKKLVPQKMFVPSPVRKTRGIAANYLCNNSKYFLGIGSISKKGTTEQDKEQAEKRDKERFKACFMNAWEIHKQKLPQGEAFTNAVLNFFEHWDIDQADNHEALRELKNEIIKGGNLVFLYNGVYVHEYESVKKQWEKQNQKTEGDLYRCSVTGSLDFLARIHPATKRIQNAHTAGASLVTFNKPAFTSFQKEQGKNAQTGEYAAFAYGEALNYLTERLTYKNYLGNTALLFYAINGDQAYQDAFSAFFLGGEDYYSEQDLRGLVNNICEGKTVDFNGERIDPNMEFYLLGIAPNNSRLSIRFFEKGTFGEFVNNIKSHQDRLQIDSGKNSEDVFIPTWQLLQETCRSGADVSPILAGELTRAIIEDIRYPATLINAIDLRIRADHKINKRKAAIIKAYYLKNENSQIPKEVLTVGLNRETDNVSYNLGRLFAVLERIQEAANPGLNATIKDKYFGGASSTPATIMPKLIELSQKHLRKLNGGIKVYYNKLLGEILDKFEDGYPKALSMPERGAFQLGYYHQMQEFFKSKKTEEE